MSARKLNLGTDGVGDEGVVGGVGEEDGQSIREVVDELLARELADAKLVQGNDAPGYITWSELVEVVAVGLRKRSCVVGREVRT